MSTIFSGFLDFIKGVLIDNVSYSLNFTFDVVNSKVSGIAAEVSNTPASWNAGVFRMIRQLSNDVVVPIAGLILTYVLTYELLSMVIERNNMQDFNTGIFFKWVVKAFVAILIATHTFDITMAIFEVSKHMVDASAASIGNTSLDFATAIGDIRPKLEAMEIGELITLWLEVSLLNISTPILSICIMLILYGRMIEVYIYCSVAPIPFATMANRDWGQIGQNYLRGLIALGLQALLIMICVAIYTALITNVGEADNLHLAIVECMGYTVLLVFSLFKTGGLSKSVMNAH